MGSEQSMPPKKQPQRAPPVRRGHTIAGSSFPAECVSESVEQAIERHNRPKRLDCDASIPLSLHRPMRPKTHRGSDVTTSGNNSPGASICSDSELPYISYTVDRPIGDSPKASAKNQRAADNKKSLLQRRQMSLQARKSKRARDIVVVKPATDTQLDEDIQRLQEIPTFLPIMRGTLGLPGARDPEVIAGLDYRPWVRMTTRLQAHLSACAQPLAADEISLAAKVKEADVEISRLYSQAVERQRANARHAERLSRVREVAHQLSRCNSLLNQTLQDIEELNLLLPEDKRLEPFVWNGQQCS